MNHFFSQLGPVGWPLLFCSFLTVIIIVERLMVFISNRLFTASIKVRALPQLLRKLSEKPESVLSVDQFKCNDIALQGIKILFTHRLQNRTSREDLLNLWLAQKRVQLYAGLKWLSLIAVVSPLLGLLGTVLGMINAFQNLAVHDGPIHPAIVADGLQQAMLTTATGLIIALPALFATHSFRILATNLLEKTSQLLNHANLFYDGITVEPETAETKFREEASLQESTI